MMQTFFSQTAVDERYESACWPKMPLVRNISWIQKRVNNFPTVTYPQLVAPLGPPGLFYLKVRSIFPPLNVFFKSVHYVTSYGVKNCSISIQCSIQFRDVDPGWKDLFPQ